MSSDEEREMDRMAQTAVERLRMTGAFPEEDLAPVIAECTMFLGKLVTALEAEEPSVSKTAALVLLVEKMRLDSAGDDVMLKVAAIVNAMNASLVPRPS